ncbi:transglutaminase domain-containing protein [uncultured Methanobrevibacter sp.]|uniref:transglutaminase domain-containing protein n=1 Tax=uncultured Methanobrevibacter sp. TaxID=253161 RepID=UPI0026154D9A|nr:transglutaminase domain-containing protein [uncultured Methanobrevibacter sp.]
MILSTFLVLLAILSIGMVCAGDVNLTDSQMSDSDGAVAIEEHYLSQPDDEMILHEQAKNQTVLSSPENDVYGYYSVVLKDSNTNATLSNRTVYFGIDGINYDASTDDRGIASVFLGDVGKYTVSAYFAGDNDYEESDLTCKVNVLPTVIVNDVLKYYKGSQHYTATFFDFWGNCLANANVSVTINARQYPLKTNSKGVATLAINYYPCSFKATTTNPVTGYSVNTTVKVLSTITSSDLKKVEGDGKNFVVKFFKNNGKPLANQNVKFKIKGKTYTVKTNANGQATLSLKNFKKGTYTVVSYNKDGYSKKNKITIYKVANTKLAATSGFYNFLSNETKQIKVKFTNTIDDVSGKSVKFIINGKTYTRKTDSKGVATLDMASFSKGLYTVDYQFDGNKFFKSAKTSGMVSIFGSTVPKLTVKSTKNFGYGAYTLFKVALAADGVPLPKRTMTFNINGVEYSEITDNSGMASVPIDLEIGNYTVTYRTNALYKISGTSASCNITVFQRDNSKLAWKCGTSFSDSSQSFKVLLTDMNGTPIASGRLELEVDGETYYGKTSSDGYATIKATSALGKNKVVVKFLGNNNFLPTSMSKTVNVKLSKFGNGLNEKNAGSLSAYLKASRNCPVNSAAIKALVKSLTKGLSDDIDKAKAIFNYVRDNIDYDYYYNTHKGATSTLKSGSGNCVDQAHLLVSMYRTAGFKARYVHGVCRFSDGVFGHVWTQVKIGNTWVVGDSISYKNSLGKINNWKTTNYKIKAKYSSLPF